MARSPQSRCWQVWFCWALTSWLGDGCFIDIVFMWPFLCVNFREFSCVFSSYKDTSLIIISSTLRTSLNLNYLLKGPVSTRSHWGLAIQHINKSSPLEPLPWKISRLCRVFILHDGSSCTEMYKEGDRRKRRQIKAALFQEYLCEKENWAFIFSQALICKDSIFIRDNQIMYNFILLLY